MQGFENKEQEREFWAALRRRFLPVKFTYVGDAATTPNILAQQSTSREVILVTKLEMNAITGHFIHSECPQQICDVGPGNGMHSVAFLEAFRGSGYKLEKYLGLDFSKALLNTGMHHIKEHFPDLQVASATWDFEKAPTDTISRWRAEGAALVTLTGHTLGNPEDPLQVLKNIFGSCKDSDILVVGVALWYECNPESFIHAYDNDVFRAAALEPLKMAGIALEKGDFGLRFSNPEKAVIAEFICRDDISIEYEGEEIRFNVGDVIRCFQSRRFVDAEVKSLLNKSGWSLRAQTYDRGKTRAVYISVRNRS